MNVGRHSRLYDPEVHERALEVVRRRTKSGASAAEIAVELRCSARTVVRYRTELRAGGVDVTPPESMRTHGSPGTYNAGCRCDLCTTAYTDYARYLRRNGPVRSHGASGYQRGCKCRICRAWGSRANALNKERRRERERLQQTEATA